MREFHWLCWKKVPYKHSPGTFIYPIPQYSNKKRLWYLAWGGVRFWMMDYWWDWLEWRAKRNAKV